MVTSHVTSERRHTCFFLSQVLRRFLESWCFTILPPCTGHRHRHDIHGGRPSKGNKTSDVPCVRFLAVLRFAVRRTVLLGVRKLWLKTSTKSTNCPSITSIFGEKHAEGWVLPQGEAFSPPRTVLVRRNPPDSQFPRCFCLGFVQYWSVNGDDRGLGESPSAHEKHGQRLHGNCSGVRQVRVLTTASSVQRSMESLSRRST